MIALNRFGMLCVYSGNLGIPFILLGFYTGSLAVYILGGIMWLIAEYVISVVCHRYIEQCDINNEYFQEHLFLVNGCGAFKYKVLLFWLTIFGRYSLCGMEIRIDNDVLHYTVMVPKGYTGITGMIVQLRYDLLMLLPDE